MFSQVVATLLRLTDRHAERWLDVRGSHDVPIYGFERLVDPPPLAVNTARLLEEFVKGKLNVGDEWEAALAHENLEVVTALAADAEGALDGGSFHFPDETWARIVYDIALAWHGRRLDVDRLVAALIPLYFARVASLIFETTDLTTDQAEAFVERQARVFELTKSYLVDRWKRSASEPVATRRRTAK
jgi:hypothetical protein